MENDYYYCMRETWKNTYQERGSAITIPWEMAQVQNMNHAYNQMEVRMKRKEISSSVSTWCIKHKTLKATLELEGEILGFQFLQTSLLRINNLVVFATKVEGMPSKSGNAHTWRWIACCKTTYSSCFWLMRLKRRIMVVKGVSNVCVEKQRGVVGTMRNGVQNMCATNNDVDALKWKGR